MSKSFDLPDVLGVSTLPEYLKRVEACIDEALSEEQSQTGTAVLRLTRARGKRLRPALVIASALLGGEVNEAVIKVAAAVELIHIGSLIHDDIIDKADSRWNIPTINAHEGLDYAILGGDFMFAKACQLAAEANQAAGVLSAQAIVQLCGGQSAELAVQYDRERTEKDLEQAAFGKTAALFAAACQLGGICSGQSLSQLKALERFGSDFGMSFQLVDDVLDFVSSDVLMGKPVGNDIKEGIYALPIILSLKGPKRDFIEKELAKTTGRHDALTSLLLENGTIVKTIAKAKDYNYSAQRALIDVYGKRAANLAQLPVSYLDWALTNLVAPEYAVKILK